MAVAHKKAGSRAAPRTGRKATRRAAKTNGARRTATSQPRRRAADTSNGSATDAVAEGDLTQKMALEIEGQTVKGEFLRIGTTVNTMVDQLASFADEVTRVAREVGTEGRLGGQAQVRGVSGTWKDLTDNVNFMAS